MEAKNTRLKTFDNLECLSVKNQKNDFPFHYHDTFCISLIHQGMEKTNFKTNSIFCEVGGISITHPYEIHSNPLVKTELNMIFDTIYLSQEMMQFYLGGKNIIFTNKVIYDVALQRLFLDLKQGIISEKTEGIELILKKFTKELVRFGTCKVETFQEKWAFQQSELHPYIDFNLKNKLSLEELANVVNMNKFNFSKKFKNETGMSPINYVLMKKTFATKKEIQKFSELTEIAYDFDFSDLAHFSKTFKRFIGISPKAYQKTLN